MFRNIIPKLVLKAVTTGDDMYVDENGKHIIFRTIRGKVVPIKTDAEGYAEWLEKQGVPIDPANQRTLRELEKELDIFSKAAEVGGPALQQKYEDAFKKQREQYAGMVQNYYQQAMQKQAKEQETTPEKLQEQKKATYEQHKDEVQSRASLPDRGWSSYIESYVNQLIDSAGAKPDEMLWYTLKAFDLALVNSVDMAKEGVSPATINLDDLVREELESGSGMREHYESRYKPYAAETKNEYSILANLYPGIENLEDNLKSNSPGAAALRDHFDDIYRKMYDDFNPQEKEKFTNIEPSIFEGSGETLPKELPEQFSPAEASALMSVFTNFRGSKLNASHRISLHASARIFDSIPDKDKVSATVAITDPKTGLHPLHKLEYRNAYERYYKYDQDIDMEHDVEEILRLAASASKSTSVRVKIQALKDIAQKLGRIDGTMLLRKTDKHLSLEAFTKRWVNSSLNAGLAKGDGPDLVNALTDSEARNSVMYTNQALKILHPGVAPKPVKEEFDGLPKLNEEEELTKTEGKETLYPGFHFSGGKILTKDGFVITPSEDTWKIKSPTGANVGSIKLQPQEGTKERERYKNYVFGVAQRLIDTYKKREPEVPKEVKRDLEENIRIPVFQFIDSLSKSQSKVIAEVTEAVSSNNLEVSTKIPGKVFRVTSGDNSIDFLYNPKKKSLMIGYRDARGNLTFDKDVSAKNVLSKLKIKAEPETKPEVKPEIKPVKAEKKTVKPAIKKTNTKKPVKVTESKPEPPPEKEATDEKPKKTTTEDSPEDISKLKVGDTKTIDRTSSFGNSQRVKIEVLPNGKAKVISWSRKLKGEKDFKDVPQEEGKVSDLSSFFPKTEKSVSNVIDSFRL